MGTSTSQASPATNSWRIARALLGRDGVTPTQQSAELWRAAVADRGPLMIEALASPILALAARLAQSARSPVEAVRAFDSEMHRAGAADLTLDMGRRALLRAVATKEGTTGFAANLFAEAAGYYVARDLASFVGSRDGVPTAGAALSLKESIRDVAQAASRWVGEAKAADSNAWRDHVERVVARLQQRGTADPAASPPFGAPKRP